MTGSWWLDLLIGAASAVLLTWGCLVIVMLIARPRRELLREALRMIPDLLRLIRRLAADKALPAGVRVRLGLLLAYLAVPVDLIPDFIPVLGYADDAILVTAVLRYAVRRAGIGVVRAHWPGTNDGFAALTRLTGIAARSEHPPSDAEVPHRRDETDTPAGAGTAGRASSSRAAELGSDDHLEQRCTS
jgi:uncharacterized membrane protein YkvA (DUF1232 family)